MAARRRRHWASLGATAPASANSGAAAARGATCASRLRSTSCPLGVYHPLAGREILLPAAFSNSSHLPLFQYSSLQRSHHFLPFPARPPNPGAPVPHFSLSSFFSYLPSTFFFFLFLSCLFIFQKAQEDLIFEMITRNEPKRNDENKSTVAL